MDRAQGAEKLDATSLRRRYYDSFTMLLVRSNLAQCAICSSSITASVSYYTHSAHSMLSAAASLQPHQTRMTRSKNAPTATARVIFVSGY